ncbi:MAG: hypothetical protein ICV73_13540 [Acetobacteraceae bacterium]|nr:hypothetical protein [Acetobacteraceae bacterium]
MIAVLLLAAAMTTGITYDEDQHIAAGVLARHLRPYADFVYLQPPLYPLLLSVVFGVAEGHYLLAGRLLTWALSLGSCAVLFGLLARLGAGRPFAALLVTACVASPFLAGPVANTRNDILPLCLLLGGLACYLRACGSGADHVGAPPLSPSRTLLALAGLCVGLAVTAKQSYVFGPPVVLLHAAMAARRLGIRPWARLAPLFAGMAAAALPAVHYLAVAPEGFLYGQIEYHLTAPIAWYAQEGQAARLGAGGRLAFLAELLVLGGNGTLTVLALVSAVARRGRGEPKGGGGAAGAPQAAPSFDGLLLGLLAGALVCGFLPNPSWPMYYAPVAPLLACWIAAQKRHLDAAGPRGHPLRLAVVAAALPAALALGPPTGALPKLADFGEWPGLAVHRNAVAIRDAIHRAHGDDTQAGDVATLFPIHVLDANPVRAEFASGPFFFRTAGSLPPDRIARLRGAGPEDLEGLFAAAPPAAIFGGTYAGVWRAPMDAALVAYAERHGYALVMQGISAGGATGGRLYLRPTPSGGAR